MDYREAMKSLTVDEIVRSIGSDRLTAREKRKREVLEAAVDDNDEFQRAVRHGLQDKAERRAEEERGKVKRCRLMNTSPAQPIAEERFVECVDEQITNDAVAGFIDRTSNASLSQSICVVCAGEFFSRETEEYNLGDVEHKEALQPPHPHPRHFLLFGMLLYEGAVTQRDEGYYGKICRDCFSDLRVGKTPPCALANNLWIGDVPLQLSILSLPERILVARYYPASYIVKLYPRGKRSGGATSVAFNSGLRGNVSTYRLNTVDITSMVEGDFLPHHPNLLAATIGVTIVGACDVPDRNLPTMLNVSRRRVHDALVFLKQNNPLYERIIISEENLRLLPDDAIPEQLLAVVRDAEKTNSSDDNTPAYVVEDEEEGDDGSQIDDASDVHRESDDGEDEVANGPDDGPCVIPLQSYAVLDQATTNVTDKKMLIHALRNATRGVEERYVVRRGRTFVNEYPRRREDDEEADEIENPSHLLGAFPALFPYGRGGFEEPRQRKLSYAEHSRWALRYADKRFRLDLRFVFQIFGVLQKRQVCASACLQIKKADFRCHEEAIRSIDTKALLESSEEEKAGRPISDSRVKALKRHLSAVRSKVIGTDESRRSVRTLIWGMTIMKNPPSLWITINPADIHDPIAQVLTGAEIDLDSFDSTSGPDATTRLTRIANDPYAASRFFHFLIDAILEELFGVKKASKHGNIERRFGIFGKVEAYIGTVEAQNRGTLHLHIIVWLTGAPTHTEMKHLLQAVEFRQRVVDYISKHIRAFHPALSPESISTSPRETNVSYARPVDPRQDEDNTRTNEQIRRLIRAVQIHKCGVACRRTINGRVVCKRRAPFALSPRTWIDADGNWGPQRSLAFMNSWNPWLMICTRANHDIQFLANGEGTKELSFYITTYAAKNQQQSSNTSALLAKSYTYKNSLLADNAIRTVQSLNKRLIQRCANTLTREQELSAPEVISYVMGWGDRYISHQFEFIHFGSVIRLLKETWWCLGNANETAEFTSEGDLKTAPKEDSEMVNLHLGKEGNLYMKDQIREYADRSEKLSEFSLFDFLRNTYDEYIPHGNVEAVPKRPHNPVFSYLPGTGHENRYRVLRREGHETMLTFSGFWFPRRNSPTHHSLYCASVLALFKPWREIRDIKSGDESFEEACAVFLDDAPPQVQKILDNIQFFYESSDKAKERRDVTFSGEEIDTQHDIDPIIETSGENITDWNDGHETQSITERDIDEALRVGCSGREAIYTECAMNLAMEFGIFNSSSVAKVPPQIPSNATHEDLARLDGWMNCIDKAERMVGSRYDDECAYDVGDVIAGEDLLGVDSDEGNTFLEGRSDSPLSNDTSAFSELNEEQKIAFTILKNKMCGDGPEEQLRDPLLMIVAGRGGTGKTKMLRAFSEEMETRGLLPTVARTATTGIASCIVSGVTLHSWAGIPARKLPRTDRWATHPSAAMAERRRVNILGKRLLCVDEMSLLTTEILALLAKVVCIVMAFAHEIDPERPFGDLSVLFMGDFHQFPPIAQLKKALFSRNPPNSICELGRFIYEQFETVVVLDQQMRITDPVWDALLDRARYGSCTAADLEEIRRLVITDERCDVPNFQVAPWEDAVLITPRNSVRTKWNMAASRKHCKQSGHVQYVCPAEDTTNGAPLSMPERLAVARLSIERTGHLAMKINISVGMKIMVTENIAPVVNLANGSRGMVKSIALDPREPPHEPVYAEDGVPSIHLHYPPSFIVVALDFTDLKPLPFLQRKELPIVPVARNFRLCTQPPLTVNRRQFALSPAYAFTDFKSQGQTIDNVIVDIGKTVNFALSPFNAYVALSRAKGRNHIRLLRDFENNLFTHPPSVDLIEEDRRLRELSEQTKQDYNAGKYGPPHLQ